MISAEKICKSYQRGSSLVEALKDVSFEIANAERVALLGKSGSGKTTLLNILSGLDRATSGSLKVSEHDLSSPSSHSLDEYRQSTVGIVFQQFRLVKHKTAAQNIAMPMAFAGISRRERKSRVKECLELVGLTERAGHFPTEMSGGEQQRVAVARAIANRPKLILADEPTGNLDSGNAEQIMELLLSVQKEVEATLLIITHDEEIADNCADRIMRLQDGCLIEDRRFAGSLSSAAGGSEG